MNRARPGVPRIVALPGSEACATRLAARLRVPGVELESRRFPDGERYLRMRGDVRDRPVILAAQLRDPDPQLPTLFFLADLLREAGATSLTLVAPYLPYMRQDARFQDGEAITSASFARWVSRAFDALVTVDPHLHRHHSLDELYAIPACALSAAEVVAAWVRRHVHRPAIVGPDVESETASRTLAERLHCPSVVLRKVRRGDRRVAMAVPDVAPLAGRTPVLVDDIVSTGHTLAQATRALVHAGCAVPVCIGVHAVLDAAPARLLARAGVERYVTCNTLEATSNAIDVTPLLAETVRSPTLHHLRDLKRLGHLRRNIRA